MFPVDHKNQVQHETSKNYQKIRQKFLTEFCMNTQITPLFQEWNRIMKNNLSWNEKPITINEKNPGFYSTSLQGPHMFLVLAV